MQNIKIGIIDLGINNLYSIQNAIKFLGYQFYIIDHPNKFDSCNCIVLPGVGTFNEGINILKKKNYFNQIIKNANSGKLFIGICLGFHMLFSKGHEIKLTSGLNLINGEVKELPKKKITKPLPHIGWNRVEFDEKNKKIFALKEDYFYFVHNFYASPKNKKIVLSTTNYSNFNFCSSIRYNNIFGFQFHPEKSGFMGLDLLDRIIGNAKKI